MRILLTGASGFLGQALCRRLREDGHLITALSREAAAREREPWSQLRHYDECGSFLEGQDCVVHLAARVHVMYEAFQDPLAEFRAANVDLTVKLAQQAARAGVRRFIFISSIKVNGEETSPDAPFCESSAPMPQDAYGRSKFEAEQGLLRIAELNDMEVVIVRPPLVYGPGVKANFSALMRAVLGGWPLPFGALRNRRSLIAVDNLVDFILVCMTHPAAGNQTFLISDGQDLSTPELVQGIAYAADVPIRLFPVPLPVLETVGALFGKREAIQRLAGNLQVNISKARILLGWSPPISVEEGLRRAVEGVNAP